ncbi:MAG TPA: ABC transporter substrate-binding protein [Xanthobacteraceae bacterium]|jgi:putative ABC transport system substrate-binding protein
MRRRDVITLLAVSAVARPLAAPAQQPALPVIGWLNSGSPKEFVEQLAAFRQGLQEAGYRESQNVAIEYRWADGRYDRLPTLAADLVRRQVTVIAATGGSSSALPAKAATTTIPIVFSIGDDPIASGLVASFNRPGGNLTGVTNLNTDLNPKRLELLHELVPAATIVGLLINPTNPTAETVSTALQAASQNLGLQLHVLHASTENEFDKVFTALAQLRAGGLVIGSDLFFNSRSEQLATLTVRHAVPAIHQAREFAMTGGLMSYETNFADMYRAVGHYTGRILKGEKPADLPVQQSTKVALIINLKTAKALGLTVPLPLLARADEVIE